MNYTFFNSLLTKVIESTSNNYKGNNETFIPGEKIADPKFSFKNYIKDAYIYTRLIPKTEAIGNIDKTWDFLSLCGENLQFLYEILENQTSKDLLIDIIALRLLGHTKVKLKTNTNQYWELCAKCNDYADKKDYIQIDFLNWKLYKTNLELFNIPISLYTIPSSIVLYEFLHQYSYTIDNVKILVEKDDYVLDCGGCFGDTALLFGYKAGKEGKVYSFEFIPSNIEIFKKNLKLNPMIENIQIIPNPLWKTSKETLYYKDNGPGSFVSSEIFEKNDGNVQTITIDDFINNNQVSKVNFIKMDIEGAELSALIGATKTIQKHKPKLAISLYHNIEDFYTIPKFIDDLQLGYTFYLGHYTLGIGETVLYAIAE